MEKKKKKRCSSLKQIRNPAQIFQIKPIQLCAVVLSASFVFERSVDSQEGTEAEMSGHALFSLSFRLCLLWASVGVVPSRAMIILDVQEQGFVSLNDMFREVGELMEDTQNRLEDAVDQITTESARSLENHHHYHHSDTKTLKDAAIAIQTDKKINRTTGETESSHVHVSSNWNNVDHECMVDEDCGELKYCQYMIDSSKCLPCIPTDMSFYFLCAIPNRERGRPV
nr:uncharacterized protein LOC125971221 isoform X2 [Syngnathus scovelli]